MNEIKTFATANKADILGISDSVANALNTGGKPDALALTKQCMSLGKKFAKAFIPPPFGTGVAMVLSIGTTAIDSYLEKNQAEEVLVGTKSMFDNAIEECSRITSNKVSDHLKKVIDEFLASLKEIQEKWALLEEKKKGNNFFIVKTVLTEYESLQKLFQTWRGTLDHELTVEIAQNTAQANQKLDNLTGQIDTIANTNGATKKSEILAKYTKKDPITNENAQNTLRAEYVKGTLAGMTQKITDWFESGKSGLWIQAPAGCGKSVAFVHAVDSLKAHSSKPNVAVFVANAMNQNLLAAIYSLSYQLSREDVDFALAIDPEFFIDPVKSQNVASAFTNLIVEPLAAINHPTLIAIDAIGSFFDEEDTTNTPEILTLFESHFSFASNVKLLITSRTSLPHVEDFLSNQEESFEKHIYDASHCQEDIMIYIKHKLARFTEEGGLQGTMVSTVSSKCGGLFIHCRLLCKTIVEKFKDQAEDPPEDVKKNFLDFCDEFDWDSSLDGLFKHTMDTCKATSKFWEEIFFILLVIQETITVEMLGKIMKDSGSKIVLANLPKTMVKLNSCFRITEAGYISIFHPMLLDYLPTYFGENYSTMIKNTHTKLAKFCIQTMKSELTTPYSLNNTNIAESKKKISPILRYCCLYWDEHLMFGEITMEVSHALAQFFEPPVDTKTGKRPATVLYWLDVMTLLGQVHNIVHAVVQVSNVFETTNSGVSSDDFNTIYDYCKEIRSFLYGGSRLLIGKPYELYRSLLLFAPTESKIASRFSEFIEPGYKIHLSTLNKWPTLMASVHAKEKITKAAVSPKCEYVAYATEKNNAGVMFTLSRKHTPAFVGHTAPITTLAISHLRSILITGSEDKTVRIWALNSNSELFNWEHEDAVESVAFAEIGRKVAVVAGGKLYIWDILNPTAEIALPKDLECKITTVAIDNFARVVYCGFENGQVKGWNIKEGQWSVTFNSHSAKINEIHISDNDLIASCSDDKLVVVADLLDTSKIMKLVGHTEPVIAISLGSLSKTIMSTSSANISKIWDISTLRTDNPNHKCLRTSRLDSSQITHIDNNSMAQILITSSNSGISGVWEATKDTDYAAIDKLTNDENSHIAENGSIILSTNGKILDTQTLQVTEMANNFEPDDVMVSNDGSVIVGLTGDGFKIFRKDGSLVVENKTAGKARHFCLSGDGNFVITANDGDKTATLWSTKGEKLHTFEGVASAITDVAITFDGSGLIISDDQGNSIYWNDVNGNGVTIPNLSSSITGGTFSHDQKLFALSTSNGYAVVRKANEKVDIVKELENGFPVTSVTFSADGKKLLCFGEKSNINIWDLESGNIVQQYHSTYGVPILSGPGIRYDNSSRGIYLFDFEKYTPKPIFSLPHVVSSDFSSIYSYVKDDSRMIILFGDEIYAFTIPLEKENVWAKADGAFAPQPLIKSADVPPSAEFVPASVTKDALPAKSPEDSTGEVAVRKQTFSKNVTMQNLIKVEVVTKRQDSEVVTMGMVDTAEEELEKAVLSDDGTVIGVDVVASPTEEVPEEVIPAPEQPVTPETTPVAQSTETVPDITKEATITAPEKAVTVQQPAPIQMPTTDAKPANPPAPKKADKSSRCC
ncbi:hypothetical protein HK103_000987 [Boothiomyces macroporosus]|uniref:Nephrocystin 3-like N-terminal domain-containing protein n=1 Tax=Boothiomyces macroporosus TaxID=261099 RepID=A0AAD5UAY3_9FUNG|nr:hypothetical protein HK103_000987 [Boothiomyces macroporosus]